MPREKLFSVTAANCDWTYFRGSGAGGQHRNKKDTAVRCTHRPSGAVGTAQDERSQAQNKKLAFRRMARTDKFQRWARLHGMKRMGLEAVIKANVDRMMKPSNLKVEIREDERWKDEK